MSNTPKPAPVAVPKPVEPPKPTTLTVVEGDTYASIAAAFKPVGMTKHEYATALLLKNKGKALTEGVEVAL